MARGDEVESRVAKASPEPAGDCVVVCLHCESRIVTTAGIAHEELTRLRMHLDGSHPETLAGKVGFYAPSPGLILEHFRVERGDADDSPS
jgi:hypothetical protein